MEQQPSQQKMGEMQEPSLLSTESTKEKYGVSKNTLIISGTILLSSLMISGAIVFNRGVSLNTADTGSVVAQQPSGNPSAPQQPVGNAQPTPTGPVDVSADDDAFLGKKDAPVAIIEFSDFQCPFCRKFALDIIPQLKKEYIDTGKVKFVYRDFPLDFHQGAKPAAEGAECAREQDKFWEMHDVIFTEQEKQGSGTIQFTPDDVKKWAGSIGLNTSKFNQCLDSGKYKEEVEKDIADGSAAGVSGTPATFINGRLIVGAQPFAALKAIIDEELKKAGK